MKRKRLKYCILTCLTSFLLVIACSSNSGEGLNEISVGEVRTMVDNEDESVFLLDVRTLEEYYGDLGHLPKATLLPYNEVESRIAELSEYKDKKIIAYCRVGRRSAIAAKILADNGFDAFNMTGGMKKWKDEYPNY